jgi:hypothetical protein
MGEVTSRTSVLTDCTTVANSDWECTADKTHRRRCLNGVEEVESEACASGCIQPSAEGGEARDWGEAPNKNWAAACAQPSTVWACDSSNENDVLNAEGHHQFWQCLGDGVLFKCTGDAPGSQALEAPCPNGCAWQKHGEHGYCVGSVDEVVIASTPEPVAAEVPAVSTVDTCDSIGTIDPDTGFVKFFSVTGYDGDSLSFIYDANDKITSIIVTCDYALKFVAIVRRLMRDYGLSEIVHVGSYVNRTTASGGLSYHSLALAVDVAGVRVGKESRERVVNKFDGDSLLYRLAMELVNEGFYVIGPPTALHEDHLHVSLGEGYPLQNFYPR